MKKKPTRNIAELASKWMEGNITDEEKRQFEKWYAQIDLDSQEFHQGDVDQVQKNIEGRLNQSIDQWERSKLLRVLYRRTAIAISAAAILIVVFFAVKVKIQHQFGKTAPIAKANAIGPGRNKAILTLSDGSDITLDGSNKGLIAHQAGAEVLENADGKLTYQVANGNNTTVNYNTITTPKGGQYLVQLPDGSKVWLNSASSLRFPTAFIANERRVTLSGEGYFEIVKNKSKPFFVETSRQLISVLGTRFNISDYPNDQSTKTTLLHGSVRLSTSTDEAILTPGKQAVSTRDRSSLIIAEADTSAVVSWKNGYFQFKNERIENIMAKIARWYDVDVQYQNGYSKKGLTGYISRYEDVSKVLHMLELTGIVKFKVQERRIMVMP